MRLCICYAHLPPSVMQHENTRDDELSVASCTSFVMGPLLDAAAGGTPVSMRRLSWNHQYLHTLSELLFLSVNVAKNSCTAELKFHQFSWHLKLKTYPLISMYKEHRRFSSFPEGVGYKLREIVLVITIYI